MKKLIFLIVCLLIIPIIIKADGLNFIAEEDVEDTKEVVGSSIIFGNNVTSDNIVEGIDMLFGNNVNFNGESDYSIILGNNVNVKGIINNDGFIFGNVITFDENVVISRDLIIFGSDITINGKINRDVRIYGMNVKINGEISGNVEVKATEITVDGKIDGTLSYNEDAIIAINGEVNKTNKTEKLVADVTFQDKLWDFIVDYGGKLVLFLAFALLVPQLFKRIDKKNEKITILNVFSLFGFGTLSLILIPTIFLMLLTLIFCMPLAILILILYIIAIWLSSIFTSYLVGNLIWKKFIKKEENIYLTGLIGISIVSILSIIPYIGVLISAIVVMFGMGIILQQFKKDN